MAQVKIKLIITLDVTTNTVDFEAERKQIVETATKRIKSSFSAGSNNPAPNSVVNNVNVSLKS